MRIFRKRGLRLGRLTLTLTLLLCAWLMTAAARADDSTYLFEVGTGAATGDEKKIDFFIITYTTENSGELTVSKFLFPWKDAWTNTYEMLSAVDSEQEKEDQMLRDTYGYDPVDLSAEKPIFQPFSTDQYLFTTPEPIKEVKRVQVFAGDKGSWACRSIRVFRVDELGGLRRWNIGSAESYIDFEGELLAEGTATQDIGWTNDRLVSSDKAGSNISFRTSGFEAYAHHSLRRNAGETLALRLDFADVYGAGLESLAAMSTQYNSLTNMGVAETMAVKLYYTDVFGMRREANVPGVLNAAVYAEKLLGGQGGAIGSFAQQGESMVIGIYLPDFASLLPNEGLTLTLGAKAATEALKLNALPGKPTGDVSDIRTRRIALSESDTASFVTMAVYDLSATQVRASVNQSSGGVEYVYSGISEPDKNRPIYYQPVSAITGASLRTGENRLSLTAYENGKNLAPADNTERYLFAVTTDAVEGAGTKDDVYLRISYTDLEGNAKSSGDLNMREMSRDFCGWWYGSEAQDMGYYKGMASGQTLRFFVPLTKVKSIENVEVWLNDASSGDDWQMKDLAISTVDFTPDKRAIHWESYSMDGVSGEMYYDRSVQATEIYRYADTTPNPVLIQKTDDASTEVGPNRQGGGNGGSGGGTGTGVDVTRAKSVDWSQLRYSMNYREASQDLGFGKVRYNYAVTVHVGGDADASAADGDCGSKNFFYFRLIFQNGNSGFVLANQQLASDGFIAGATQTFVISTNQDYGEVTAVQIIPEQASDNSDVFDKLMIRSIDIKRQSSAALVPVWTVSSVGWISIDYQDSAQMQSVTGLAGRSASDVTRSFAVDGSTYEVNFMIAIQTEGYPANAEQFQGNISAIVNYASDTPGKGREEIGDVTKLMYDYINHTPIGMPDSIGGKTISDPSIMHRANHTDRFIFPLSDVRSIYSIELQITSAVATKWKIAGVSLFQVMGEGTLVRNAAGEYEQVYSEGEKLKTLAYSTSTNVPAYEQQLTPYDPTLNADGEKANSYSDVITVTFTENKVELSPEAAQWTSAISREPVSENDTLNFFLYPKDTQATGQELVKTKVDPDNPPVATIVYTEAGTQTTQESTGDLSRAIYNDQSVLYATGLNASRFGVLNGVTLYNGRGTGIQGKVRAVVQQVRSGVVIKTWTLEGSGSTDPGGMLLTDVTDTSTWRRQRVQLQLGTNIEKTVLVPESDNNAPDDANLAVALWYRSDDPAGMELRSPYIYLTDDGKYSQINPGQLIELTFEQENVGEILGFSVVAMGNVSGVVDAARIVDEEMAAAAAGTARNTEVVTTRGVYGTAQSVELSKVPYRNTVERNESLKDLSIDFTSAQSTGSMSAGTEGPVRMTLGYYDPYGNLLEKTYEDIRPYLTNGDTGFRAGTTSTVRMLVEDLAELRWIELEPLTDPVEAAQQLQSTGETRRAMWVLSEISARTNETGSAMHRDVGAQLVEGDPVKLSMADILLTGTMDVLPAQTTTNTNTATDSAAGQSTAQSSAQTATQNADSMTLSGTANDRVIESGESIRITPALTGSTEPMRAVLESLDIASGATGKVSLADTRGYTEASITQFAESAAARAEVFAEAVKQATTDSGRTAAQRGMQAANEETAMWKALKPAIGDWRVLEKRGANTGSAAWDDLLSAEDDVTGSDPTGSEVLTLNKGDQLVFTPPRNFTGANRSYRVTVYSTENASAKIVLNVTVGYESDPTTKSVAQLNQEMLEAQNAQSDAQNESNENLLRIIEELTGQLKTLQARQDAMDSMIGLGG